MIDHSPLPTVWELLERALSPIEERPCVVTPLEAAHHTTRAGAPYVVVRNPVANTYLKLDPREYDLLSLMDGSQTVKELVVAYYQRHGVLALPRIVELVRLLRVNHMLTDVPLDAYASLEGRLQDSGTPAALLRRARALLHADIRVRGMDHRLSAWYRAWGWLFFTRPAIGLAVVLGVLGPCIFLLELARGRYDPFRVSGSYLLGLGLLLVLGVLALAAHELAHGLAVKHAGRFVPRAGLMLYYGLPALYVDTTDIWMAPRDKRLLTSAAGPWAGLVLGGLCALAALLLPYSPLGAVLFVAAFVFLLDNLLNFNPLLELDGYYLLVDYLDKPMLRARALRFVRGPLWSTLARRAPVTLEERWFAVFGLACLAWAGLTLFMLLRFWDLRVEPVAVEIWRGGDVVARAILMLVGLALGAPIVAALLDLARQVFGWTSLKLTWLGGQAAILRHGEALAALRAVPLWADLPEARLLEVAAAMHAQDVWAGTEVVRQGESGDRFYVIASGAFEVLVDGRPEARLQRGDYFGERALLTRATRAATVLALGPGRVFWLDQAVFHATLAHDVRTRARLEAALAYRADVAEMPLFLGLSSVEMDLLLSRLVPTATRAGEEVIRQGEPGDRFYIVRSGRLEVSRDGELLARLGPGEAFGEIALLLNVPRTASVRALEPTELLALNASDFRDLLAGYCGREQELERLSHLRLEMHKRLDQVGVRGSTALSDNWYGAGQAGRRRRTANMHKRSLVR